MINKSKISLIVIAFILGTGLFVPAQARVATPSSVVLGATPTPDATQAAQATATPSAQLASPSAEVVQKIQEKKDQDITETTGKQKDKLIALLEETPQSPLSWHNFLSHAIRYAVKEGVPPNIIVLVVLFPLIASFIAASRHIVGLRGFGIYVPAVLSVALVSTGLVVGLSIFLCIVAVAILSKKILKQLDLSYLPRTALLLWLISLGILAVILTAPILDLTNVMTINIFPILILVLLSENFLDAQASTKPSNALWLTLETIGLAFVSGYVLKLEIMQRLALLQPEILIVATAVFDYLVGKFVGLRISEWLRFRPIIEE